MDRPNFWAAPYKAPSLPGTVVLFLIIAFACFSFSRGLDLVFGDNSGAIAPLMKSSLNSMDLWGGALMAGASYLILTLCLRIQGLVWTGHVFLCAVYFGFFSMLAQTVIFKYHGDGGMFLLAPLGGFIWHALFVWLSRPWAPTRAGRERV